MLTDRQLKNKLKKIDARLVELAVTKANGTGNDYVMTLLRGVDAKCMTQAERDMLNDYLDIPAGTMWEV